jgi:hypothetical protein
MTEKWREGSSGVPEAIERSLGREARGEFGERDVPLPLVFFVSVASKGLSFPVSALE